MSLDPTFVEDGLSGGGGPWSPRLAAALADDRWRSLASTIGLDRGDYGTVRHATRDAGAPRRVAARIVLPRAFAAPTPLSVEALEAGTLARYRALGLDFEEVGGSRAAGIEARLREAFDKFSAVPEAAEAVGAVLAALHVLRPSDPCCDVSYSDPDVPFSIFVGVGGADGPNDALRVAEGVLHESMHLLLSLVEAVVPMVATDVDRLHSPWRATVRPAQGVLHGLYVFRAIQRFHRALLEAGDPTAEERAHAEGRIRTIEEEVGAIDGLTSSCDLTPAGRRLASLLLSNAAPVP